MDEMLLSRYNFADITVFMKTEEGYLNITDYYISEAENQYLYFESESKYIIMFCSFSYALCEKKGVKPYICSVSIDELIELSGIHDKSFLRRFACSNENDNEELLAILCARKILDYRYGKAIKDGNSYSFYRQGYYKENGKNRRHKVLVFKKTFYEGLR